MEWKHKRSNFFYSISCPFWWTLIGHKKKTRKKTKRLSATILRPAVCVKDVMNKADMHARATNYILNTSDLPRRSHLLGLLCPPVYLLSHFPSLWHVQGSTPTGVFKDGFWPSTHSSQGFPFHFLLFAASSLNLWGWWHVWSDCKSSTSLFQSEENVGQNQPVNLHANKAGRWVEIVKILHFHACCTAIPVEGPSFHRNLSMVC